ncbi:hypothetical protein LMG9449_1485 [Lactococcus lactis subsp. lactis]|uniref:Uncharacterized protein n=1 Tax=Lactococcus lactis subsp. lactis TaxID=1360 RepID=A0A0V8DWF3_LACLL|nr:hypothetical protein [Lactococcus lactis]KSU17950.1 hypothetical protein LMG9449_1485 [Lactococcus lactis subsp. lactis]MDT2919286.1 hypothetical protein [Lactococcus lactis]MDT2939203.1 hypothetical protein [Lactococcus lactis]
MDKINFFYVDYQGKPMTSFEVTGLIPQLDLKLIVDIVTEPDYTQYAIQFLQDSENFFEQELETTNVATSDLGDGTVTIHIELPFNFTNLLSPTSRNFTAKLLKNGQSVAEAKTSIYFN